MRRSVAAASICARMRRCGGWRRWVAALKRLYPEKESSLLAEKLEDEPPASDEYGGQHDPHTQSNRRAGVQASEPTDRAALGPRPTEPDDHARPGRQHAVARHGLPPDRGWMKLAETMAVGRLPVGDVD